jgi:hypothetical protein
MSPGFSAAQGETFLMSRPGAYAKEHLWIVAFAYGDRVAIVNVTTTRGPVPDPAAVHLVPGDHPFIQHASHLFFADARLTDRTKVLALTRSDPPLVTSHSSCSNELLRRVQDGLIGSEFTSIDVVEFCRACRDRDDLL